MDTLLLIVIGGLLLYILYLQLRLSSTPTPTIVVMPNTADQGSDLGCVTIMLIILIVVLALALLGLLPSLKSIGGILLSPVAQVI